MKKKTFSIFQPTREQLKEARKQMEAFIAMNKESTDAKTQADVAEMEQALAMLDLLGIHWISSGTKFSMNYWCTQEKSLWREKVLS